MQKTVAAVVPIGRTAYSLLGLSLDVGAGKCTGTTDVLTGALVVVTAVYAALTYGIMRATSRSVSAMESQTEALTRPYVTIAPMTLPGSPILFLRVRNAGRTTAERLRLEIEKPFYRFGNEREDENIQTFSAFSEEIASFAPGCELVFALGQAFVIFAVGADEAVTPQTFKVSARYSFGARTVDEATEVDLRPYRGMHLSYDPVVSELSGIKDALSK